MHPGLRVSGILFLNMFSPVLIEILLYAGERKRRLRLGAGKLCSVLPGFGKLVKQKRKARSGFNPKTQQKIKIPAKTVVKFRVAKAAKDEILGVKK